MTTPTPKDTPPFDPPVFCSGIERDCKHGQLARSCNICELERELAAAQEARQRAEEQVLSRIIGIATVGNIDGHEVIRRQSAIDVVRMVFAAIDSAREALK